VHTRISETLVENAQHRGLDGGASGFELASDLAKRPVRIVKRHFDDICALEQSPLDAMASASLLRQERFDPTEKHMRLSNQWTHMSVESAVNRIEQAFPALKMSHEKTVRSPGEMLRSQTPSE
jgi:hypothetical protein